MIFLVNIILNRTLSISKFCKLMSYMRIKKTPNLSEFNLRHMTLKWLRVHTYMKTAFYTRGYDTDAQKNRFFV